MNTDILDKYNLYTNYYKPNIITIRAYYFGVALELLT
jgi:hypothetical protein